MDALLFLIIVFGIIILFAFVLYGLGKDISHAWKKH
jgi:hypothetical protein